MVVKSVKGGLGVAHGAVKLGSLAYFSILSLGITGKSQQI